MAAGLSGFFFCLCRPPFFSSLLTPIFLFCNPVRASRGCGEAGKLTASLADLPTPSPPPPPPQPPPKPHPPPPKQPPKTPHPTTKPPPHPPPPPPKPQPHHHPTNHPLFLGRSAEAALRFPFLFLWFVPLRSIPARACGGFLGGDYPLFGAFGVLRRSRGPPCAAF